MRKIFLFLFAAVLSIGTAMAQTQVHLTDATVALEGQNLVVQAQWGERPITISLWQQNIQGTGTYAAADIYCEVLNPWGEWTATTDENTYQEMGGSFSFSGYFTDGTETYDVWIQGSTESSTPETNEMEAKNYVHFTCDADGAWTIEAYADDDSWILNLELEMMDPMTGECSAYGSYVTDMETWASEEVYGTGQLYYDDFTGRQVFKATSMMAESGEIYPVLYASQLNLETEQLMAGASWWNEFVGAEYYNVYLQDKNYSWELDLHVSGTGANGEYLVEVVSEEDGLYSTFSGYKVLGELTIEDGMYDASVYTLDMGGNPAMNISCFAMQVELTEYTINVNNATVVEDLSQYGSSWSMKGEVELEGTTYPVTVEIADEVDLTVPSAEVYLSVTVEELGFVDGNATLTINGNTMAVEGELENEYAGVKFVFNISGTLPTCANIRLQAGSNAGILAAADGKQVNVTVSRSFTANDGYYTLCVPFDMPASVIGKAYQISEVLGNSAAEITVNFTEVTTILAGQPYLIEPATNLDGFTVNNVTIDNSTPAAVTVSGAGVSITMQGKYSRDAKTDGSLYWVGNDGYLYNDPVWPTALCAYFTITTPSGIAPRMRVVANENAETGLENINAATKAVKAIENGQLIITIDGVKYNVQGVKL